MIEDLTYKVYPGKVLLFGEYTVIHGSDSLAIPFYKKTANWDYDDLEFESRESLDRFIDYLIVQGIAPVDIDHFSEEWKNGLFLESNIPSGYGVGSSGSVVAAVYDAFINNKEQNPQDLRSLFMKMENFFHRSSSGIDPLVSFYGKAVHVKDQELHLLDLDQELLSHLYLWDSCQSRHTAPFVNWYKEKIEEGLLKQINEKLLPFNEKLIDGFLDNDHYEFDKAFEKVEQFQLNYFVPMFPRLIRQNLLEIKKEYNAHFKLCGAGGGGYYLVYCKDEKIRTEKNILPLI